MRNGPYTLVKSPENYPGKRYRNRYVYEHQLVWWENTGILVPIGYHIHHKNEVKTDNRFCNLELIHQSTHCKIHNRKKILSYLNCSFCKKIFVIETRNYKFKSKKGQKNFYCCRSHMAKHMGLGYRKFNAP